MVDLTTNPAGCHLPCLLNIRPGETTWAEAKMQFQQWGSLTDDIPLKDQLILHGVGGTDIYPERIHQNLDFLEKNQVIERIYIQVEGYSNPKFFEELWKGYSPRQILIDYGIPDRIYVYVHDDKNYGSDGTTLYYLWLVYDHVGFYIEYHGFVRYGSNFRICPQFDQNRYIQWITIFTQSPGENIDLHQSIDLSENHYTEALLSLEEAAKIGREDFNNRMTAKGGSGCIDTPLKVWQTPTP